MHRQFFQDRNCCLVVVVDDVVVEKVADIIVVNDIVVDNAVVDDIVVEVVIVVEVDVVVAVVEGDKGVLGRAVDGLETRKAVAVIAVVRRKDDNIGLDGSGRLVNFGSRIEFGSGLDEEVLAWYGRILEHHVVAGGERSGHFGGLADEEL